MKRLRRWRTPSILIVGALALALIFAATAAAETKIGEGTSPADSTLPGEVDLLKATANYEGGTGGLTFNFTTRDAPFSQTSPPHITYFLALLTIQGPCNETTVTAANSLGEIFPGYAISTENEPAPAGEPSAAWIYAPTASSGPSPENTGEAAKTVSGSTTTLAATVANAANGPFNCVEAKAEEGGGENKLDELVFPLASKAVEPASKPAPAPVVVPPTPAALSLAKAKPVTLKGGKWKTLKFKVSNSGGTAVGPIALKLKAPKGITIKPGTTKLPALLAGQTWTVSFQVKATATAKKSSKLTLTSTSGALSTTSSFLLKLAGG
jgi:NPCBM-associated, NEW3 domain of alpha-galactosidase